MKDLTRQRSLLQAIGAEYANYVGDSVEICTNKLLKGSPLTSSYREDIKAEEQMGCVTGMRKALLIGINYYGQDGAELRGCINDVRNIEKFIESNYKYDAIMILTDDHDDPNWRPTRENILRGFRWLRRDAKCGDSLLLHYSGHGAYVEDLDGDESDGFDETLLPVDYQTAGHIVDDEIHDVLVRGLPAGVRLTAIMDCCHSGSVLDLPYSYRVNGDLEVYEDGHHQGIAKIFGSTIKYAMDRNKRKVMKGLTEGWKLILAASSTCSPAAARKRAELTRSTDADVIQFSGCQDEQTSTDAYIDGQATGAMSYALITALKEDKNRDYTNLLCRMREILLAGQFEQVPMMSAGRKLDLNNDFDL